MRLKNPVTGLVLRDYEWHLRKSRAPEFTEALTREFLEKFVAPAMRSAQPAPSVDSTKTGA